LGAVLEMGLTKEQCDLRDRLRVFVDEKVTPAAKYYDERGEFPSALVEEAEKMGLLRMAVPKEYGGPGSDALTSALVAEELSRGCLGYATIVNGNALGSYTVLLGGNDEQKRYWYQYLLDGKLVGFALTEPGAGSDAAAIQTTAVRSGDEYVLNGAKCFITTGAQASIFTIIASTDPLKGTKGLSAFIVEAGREGFSVGRHEDKMGIRASNTTDLVLRDVRIPKEHRIGAEGVGFKLAMQCLDSGRINVAAMAVGLSQAALEAAVLFVKTRQANGKPLSRSQDTLFKLADIATAVEASRNMVYKVCYLKDSGQPYTKEAAMAKLFCTDTAVRVASAAMDICGVYGYSKASPTEKLMRDAKIMQIFEGTNQVQRIVVGSHALM
jgi:alkylation response protein AidB-like acyl-CoA dehydrogenase